MGAARQPPTLTANQQKSDRQKQEGIEMQEMPTWEEFMIPTLRVLSDGARLTQLMIQYRVGIQVRETYKVVAIEEDLSL